MAEPCRVIVGDEVIDTRPLLIALANSAQYGNGARIAPDARIDDGLLDVVVVEATSLLRDLFRARRLFTGSLAKDPWTTLRRGASVRIESDGPRAGARGRPAVRDSAASPSPPFTRSPCASSCRAG